MDSSFCRLLYCTNGILIHQLESDPYLSKYSHIIVDEVHERSIQSDFLLVHLKRILEVSRKLKIVLMSATLDVSVFDEISPHDPSSRQISFRHTLVASQHVPLLPFLEEPFRSQCFTWRIAWN